MKKDQKNKMEAEPQKKKKKRKKAPVIIAAVVVLLIVVRLVACSNTKDAPAYVTTTAPVRGELQESISTSGVVQSEEKKVYFAPVAGTLGKVNVAAGDVVKGGELLVGYDEAQLERSYKEALLQRTSNNSSYQSTMADSAEKQSKLNEANTNLSVLEQQIKDNEAYLEKLQDSLDQNQRDTINSLGEESLALGNRVSQIQQEMAEMDKTSPEYAAKAQELSELSASQSRNSYLQQVASSSASDYAVKMQKEINEVTKRLNEYKEYKAEMESQKNSSEGAILDGYQKAKYNADNEMANLSFQKAEEDYYTAKKGVVADFDGIVMECTAMEGAMVTEGTQLLSLASSNDIKVVFHASKYDLAKLELGQKAELNISDHIYEGEIAKINRMAEPNNSGTAMVGVEIHITNPDERIVLGLDAKIEVFTHKVQEAILVPVEAINADKDGDFLYVVENGKVVRKPIVCGISSDTFTEVVEGITEQDQVILTSLTALSEGMTVAILPTAGAIGGAGAPADVNAAAAE